MYAERRAGDRGCRDERLQVRKVRASKGRMPDNVRWRKLPGKCNRKEPPAKAGKGAKAG